MQKKDKDLWIGAGLLGAVGLIYYFYNKNKAVTPPSTTSIAPPLPPTTTVPLPAAPAPQTGQLTTAIYNTPVAPAAIPLTEQQATVISFFKTDLDEANLNQFMNSYPSFTSTEWAGLWDLVVNDWQGGQGNTPARKQFWDSWRTKYHILDGTYS